MPHSVQFLQRYFDGPPAPVGLPFQHNEVGLPLRRPFQLGGRDPGNFVEDVPVIRIDPFNLTDASRLASVFVMIGLLCLLIPMPRETRCYRLVAMRYRPAGGQNQAESLSRSVDYGDPTVRGGLLQVIGMPAGLSPGGIHWLIHSASQSDISRRAGQNVVKECFEILIQCTGR